MIIHQGAQNRNIYVSCQSRGNVCSASPTEEFCGSGPAKIHFVPHFPSSALPGEADRITWSASAWGMPGN